MITKIIKYYIVFLVIFFSWAGIASAEVVISRINLDPIGERFIELYNNSNLSQNLTDWSIKRKSSSGLEYSLVSSTRLENKIIEANGYFLLTNESNYTGTLSSDATWAKSYTFAKDNIILLYNQNDEIVNSFKVSTTSNDETSSNTDTENENSSEEEIIPVLEEDPEILKITTKIISPKMVTAGIPFSMDSLTTTNKGQTYAVGRFVWNFGNGEISEVGKAVSFDYVYEYSGEYVVTLSYFDSVFSKVADATHRMTIKVIPADIYISSVGNDIDPFIELENKSNYEIILSNWVVTGGIHYFKIPEGMTLLPNKKVKLSPKITGFVGEDIKTITITNANKDLIATYPITKIKKTTQKNTSTYAIAQNSVSSVNQNLQNDSSLNNSQIINLNDLSADAGGANVNIKKSTYAWVGLLIIIGLGLASFIFIKRRDSYDDYVEKEIRAEDMTIVE